MKPLIAIALWGLVACEEPFNLHSRYPLWTDFVGECGVRRDQVLACERTIVRSDRNRTTFSVYDGPADAPKVSALAYGSAGRDGCALTVEGQVHCYGALSEAPQPSAGAPFSELALKTNGLAMCGLTAEGTITCAAMGGAAGIVAALPNGQFRALGGFVGNTALAIDAAGAFTSFGADNLALDSGALPALSQLRCDDTGCAALSESGALYCLPSNGATARLVDLDSYSDVVRTQYGCCALRFLGDVICVDDGSQAAPWEFGAVRFKRLNHVPGIGLCGPTVSGAGICVTGAF